MQSSSTPEGTIPLQVVHALRVLDFACASVALARRRKPVRFWSSVAFAVLWLALGSVVLAIGVDAGDDAPALARSAVSVLFVVFVALPYSRAWAYGVLLRAAAPTLFQPMTIVGLSRTHLVTVTSIGNSNVAFSSYDERYDFGSSLVLAREGTAIPFVIARRAFEDEGTFLRIRDAMLAAPIAAVVDAATTFSEPVDETSFRYVLTIDEFRRGSRLLTARSWRRFVRPGLALALIAVVATAVALSSEPSFTLVALGTFIAVLLPLAVRRYRIALTKLLLETKLSYDETSVSIESKSSRLSAQWSDTRGCLEDEQVLVIALPNDVGIVVPKRVAPRDALAFFREKLAKG